MSGAGDTVFEQSMNELHDLAERLREKGTILARMSEEATTLIEAARLSGKCQGVNLALSFIEEMLR